MYICTYAYELVYQVGQERWLKMDENDRHEILF